MSLAAGLNLIWLLTVLSAFGALIWTERRRRARFRDRMRRGFAVFLAAVALFPCISASDDLVRFGLMPRGQGSQAILRSGTSDASEGGTVHLARLLQVLESFQLSAAAWLGLTLVFCCLFLRLCPLSPECWTAAALIRGPPRCPYIPGIL
jgi:hypothetical protein